MEFKKLKPIHFFLVLTGNKLEKKKHQSLQKLFKIFFLKNKFLKKKIKIKSNIDTANFDPFDEEEP